MQSKKQNFNKDRQYYKFCFYGFLKNLRFFEPFLLLFLLAQGMTYLQIGILISIREIGRNLLEIPAGIISDTIGRKKTMISCFIFYILSFATFYFGHAYGIFVLAMIIYALGDSFRTGTHKAMIFDYLRIKGWSDQKVYYYGHTRSYSQIGSAVSSLIAAVLVFFSGNYRVIFLYTVIPYILDLILIASYPNNLNGPIASFKKEKIIKNFKKVFLDFINSFRRKKTLRAVANLSLHTGYYQALKDYLQPVIRTLSLSLPVMVAWQDKQRTAVFIGVIYFVIYLLTAYASRHAGKFSSKFDRLILPLNITLLAGLIFGIFSGLFYVWGLLILSVVFYIVIYINENLRKPVGIGFVTEVINNDILATVLSAESQAHSLIAAALAPLIGFVADQAGLGYSIVITSGVLLLFAPFYWLKKEEKKA